MDAPDLDTVWDPAWLRASHPACLWDGRIRPAGRDFCSHTCEEAYAAWEHRRIAAHHEEAEHAADLGARGGDGEPHLPMA